MRPQFTPAVERAVEQSQAWAQRQARSEIEPIHLLWALLEEKDGRAAVLLTRHGADLDCFLRDQPTAHDVEASKAPTAGERARGVLSAARELAWSLSLEQSVSSECLLLAILRADQDVREKLRACELNYDEMEIAIAGQVGEPVELDEPLHLEMPSERMSLARILDAGANRAREALRVVEDYARFAFDDAFLTNAAKQLRHDLTQALLAFPGSRRTEARETNHDVGTALSTKAERERYSLNEVMQINWKRLQEALRSLEEHGKLHSPEMGAEIKQIRYRSYTLERAMLLGVTARERFAECRIQVLLTASRCKAALDWTIAEAAAGGADVFQLREKDLPDRELVARARDVRRWTRDAGALFVVNDRPDVARLVEADGVHLGQDDLPVKDARRILGPDALIGVSTHDLEQLHRAVLDGASYVGVGPTFTSKTKDFPALAGLEFVKQAAAETSLPIFAIGGVNVKNLASAVQAGARRIAVSNAVCSADEPRAVVRELRRLLECDAEEIR